MISSFNQLTNATGGHTYFLPTCYPEGQQLFHYSIYVASAHSISCLHVRMYVMAWAFHMLGYTHLTPQMYTPDWRGCYKWCLWTVAHLHIEWLSQTSGAGRMPLSMSEQHLWTRLQSKQESVREDEPEILTGEISAQCDCAYRSWWSRRRLDPQHFCHILERNFHSVRFHNSKQLPKFLSPVVTKIDKRVCVKSSRTMEKGEGYWVGQPTSFEHENKHLPNKPGIS